MDAFVTLKVTPQEFDLLRQALRSLREVCEDQKKDADPAERHKLNQIILQTSEMLSKLGS